MREHPASRPHRVAVVAPPGVVAFDLTIATQVFGHDGAHHYEVTVCGLTAGTVATTSGFGIVVEADLSALEGAGTVLVPGFARGPIPPALLDALVRAHAAGSRMVSICTGAFALAEAGLLDGRRATTHWAHAPELARTHPAVRVDPGVLYVDEGQVLTSAGMAAGLDLCLYLVGRDHGADAATERARQMVTPLHRAGGQAQYLAAPDPGEDPDLAAVTRWARDHLADPLTTADLASRALCSPRTLARRFTERLGTSPHAWLTAQRVQLATRLLERSDLTIDQVAARAGLGTAANFRLHLHRSHATTPTTYRAAFAATATKAPT